MNNRPDYDFESAIILGMIPEMTSAFLLKLKEEGADLAACASDAETLNRQLGLYPGHGFSRTMIEEGRRMAGKATEAASRHNVRLLTPFGDDYPKLLAHTADYPKVLFKYGELDLNSLDHLAIVGTRHCTAYGDGFVRQSTASLAAEYEPFCIVSGLAYGIDAAAHESAIENGLPTVAVLAHGLGMIYPSAHRTLAERIVSKGGVLLTEYQWEERPYRQRFLERNRIVAGMSKVTFVAESAYKGGALSTAASAFRENRTVLALPGRVSDMQSAGCNRLIYEQKAGIATDYKTIAREMELREKTEGPQTISPPLFSEPEGEGRGLYALLRDSAEPMHLDEICARSGMPASKVMAILGDMEFDSLIMRYPGNRFAIC